MSTLFEDTFTGNTPSQYPLPQTGASLAADSAALHQRVRVLQLETHAARRDTFALALDEAALRELKRPPVNVLADLRSAGFAWRDVARVVGVSVPAVQKWRRGDGIDPSNRHGLARLIALVSMLRDDLIDDPVSWLETDVRPGVHLSKLDLLACGRFDLVHELASDRSEDQSVDAVLDQFDPGWRDRYVDESFEVFTGHDGALSVRPRW